MTRILALPATLLLGACTTEPPPPAEPARAPALIDAQVQAMERAAATEREVLEAQKRVDRALDEDGGG